MVCASASRLSGSAALKTASLASRHSYIPISSGASIDSFSMCVGGLAVGASHDVNRGQVVVPGGRGPIARLDVRERAYASRDNGNEPQEATPRSAFRTIFRDAPHA